MREPAGSRLRYLAGGCAGLRVDGCAGLQSLAGSCGCAGVRGSGSVIWFVWLKSWLVGAGAREPAGSRLRYLGFIFFYTKNYVKTKSYRCAYMGRPPLVVRQMRGMKRKAAKGAGLCCSTGLES